MGETEEAGMTCDHVIAFHVGHSEIRVSQVKEDPDIIKQTCCGGIMDLPYCPMCGEKLSN